MRAASAYTGHSKDRDALNLDCDSQDAVKPKSMLRPYHTQRRHTPTIYTPAIRSPAGALLPGLPDAVVPVPGDQVPALPAAPSAFRQCAG